MFLKENKLSWKTKTLLTLLLKEQINFDLAIQRSLVWKPEAKSLLIHSILTNFPIPPFYANRRTSDKTFDILDGKQRLSAVAQFMNGEFGLTSTPPFPVEVYDEETKVTDVQEIDLRGKTFSELPKEMQEEIEAFVFDIRAYDDLSPEDQREMFLRLNGGKPLTAMEIIRAGARSLDMIVALSKHDLFKVKNYAETVRESIIIKAWALLYQKNPTFESKFIRPLTKEAEITLEQGREISAIFSYLTTVYNIIKNSENALDPKLPAKVADKVVTQTHLLALVKFADEAIIKGIPAKDFADWLQNFYVCKKGTSTSEEYNTLSKNNTASPTTIQRRETIVRNNFKNWFASHKFIPTVDANACEADVKTGEEEQEMDAQEAQEALMKELEAQEVQEAIEAQSADMEALPLSEIEAMDMGEIENELLTETATDNADTLII